MKFGICIFRAFRNKSHLRKIRFLNYYRKPFFKKSASVLPNIFTLGNAMLGFCSIIFASNSEWIFSSYAIFFGAVLDLLDGKIARLIGASSNFGMELDSFADAITFCLAPSILAYSWHLKKMGFLGILICAIFFIAGIIRLARFNLIKVENSIFFVGMPTTIAGCLLVSLMTIGAPNLVKPTWLFSLAIIILILSYSMVSRIPFPNSKKEFFSKVTTSNLLSYAIFLYILFFLGLHAALASIFFSYFCINTFKFCILSKNSKDR